MNFYHINWKTATNADIEKISNDTPRKDGTTPLHMAAGNSNNPEIISTLINAGADVKAQNKADINKTEAMLALEKAKRCQLTRPGWLDTIALGGGF